MKVQESSDEYYKQIFYSNDYLIDEQNSTIRINLPNRSYLLIFIFLISTSQSKALPISQINYHHLQQPTLSFPIDRVQLTDRSTPSIHSYKFYRVHTTPNYPNEVIVQVSDQTNFFNQQQQLTRERYRRTMIDRLFSKFDEDVNGQLSKDELYSLSLRLNIFPRFHHFLKNQQQENK